MAFMFYILSPSILKSVLFIYILFTQVYICISLRVEVDRPSLKNLTSVSNCAPQQEGFTFNY